MKKETFIGRKKELSDLNALLNKKTASLVVIKGRRRIGKSRLIDQFSKKIKRIKFTGLAPSKGITAQHQRDEFSHLLNQQTGIPEFKTKDWSKLFILLSREVKDGKVIIILDEISWMAHLDPTFLPKLKNAWDESFKNNPHLILILCGSISTWIEENIVSSTAFLGRISWTINLAPLSLSESNQMLEAQGFKFSAYEKFKVLSVTGGIPWYLEQIQGQLSADQNIKRLCFTEGGILLNDFDIIFHDLFEKRDSIFKKIIESLSGSPLDYSEIANKISYHKSGTLSKYLDELVQAGFISKDFTWSLKKGTKMDLAKYRLSDNYIRFYLKYIREKRIKDIELSQFTGIETILGLQFENLVVNNKIELFRFLNIELSSIVYDNPFFQKKTARQKGCQVDFLIQTKFKTLYVCEIKFSRNILSTKVVDEVKEKISRISLPRGTSILPVLIHVNGIADSIKELDYFYSIINFSDLLH